MGTAATLLGTVATNLSSPVCGRRHTEQRAQKWEQPPRIAEQSPHNGDEESSKCLLLRELVDFIRSVDRPRSVDFARGNETTVSAMRLN